MGLAVALDLQGRHQEAQELYETLLQSRNGDLTLQVNYGASLIFSGEAEKAISVLSSAVRYPGAPPQARMNLALALAFMGENDKADKAGFGSLPPAERRESLAFLRWARGKWDSLCRSILSPRAKDSKVKDFECPKTLFGNAR